jgi:predicted NUDIX family NTP pyrophosphohydrolase
MDCDPARLVSNTFTFRGRQYPEVDRAAWFPLDEAVLKILKGQVGFLTELDDRL